MVGQGWHPRWLSTAGWARGSATASYAADPRLHRVALGLRWIVVCWVVLFWRLGYLGLFDDGAHYAQLTREMLQQGSWFVPLLDGQPFIDKPVLFHWLQSLSFALFGESELGARLPSALGGVGLFLITRWLSAQLWDRAMGERAWLMLATIPATFALGRVGYLDMVFTLFTFGAVACLLVAAVRARPRLVHAGTALLALAVMTKGPVAIALVAALFAVAWAAGGASRRAIRSLDWRKLALGVVVGSAPWFAWMYWQFGDDFVRGYLLDGHLFYLAPRASASSARPGFYVQMFMTAFFPWSLVAVGYGLDTLLRLRQGHKPPVEEVLLWTWILAVIALFTAAQFRVDRYIYPAAPACCMLAARGWVAARTAAGPREFLMTRLSILLFALVLVGSGVALAVALPGLDLRATGAAFLLPAWLLLGGLVVAVLMIARRFAPPLVVRMPLFVMLAVYATIVAVGFPVIDRSRPVRQVARWLHEQAPNAPVGVYRLERWHTALRFYADQPIHPLSDDEEVKRFLSQKGGSIVMRRREYLAMRERGLPGRVLMSVPVVRGTEGRGIRRQVWGEVYVVGGD